MRVDKQAEPDLSGAPPSPRPHLWWSRTRRAWNTGWRHGYTAALGEIQVHLVRALTAEARLDEAQVRVEELEAVVDFLKGELVATSSSGEDA